MTGLLRDFRIECRSLAAPVLWLGLAAALVLLTLSPPGAELAPSQRALLGAAAPALLAPLFWPGTSSTRTSTLLRLLGWCAAVAGLALLGMFAIGTGRAGAMRWASASVAAAVVAASSTACAVALQARAVPGRAMTVQRDIATVSTAVLLWLLCATPVLLAPLVELLQDGSARAANLAVAASPLTHLALAAGNDLLRNDWFYANSSLGSLRFDYPPLGRALIAQLVGAALLLSFALAGRTVRPAANQDTNPQESPT